jgi:hypothetical protein
MTEASVLNAFAAALIFCVVNVCGDSDKNLRCPDFMRKASSRILDAHSTDSIYNLATRLRGGTATAGLGAALDVNSKGQVCAINFHGMYDQF